MQIVNQELGKLDNMISNEIGILRERIEEANRQYNAARYVCVCVCMYVCVYAVFICMQCLCVCVCMPCVYVCVFVYYRTRTNFRSM